MHNLNISSDAQERLISLLDANTSWFSGILEGVHDAQALYYMRIFGHDIKQFRNQRHTALIRKISELTLLEQQEHLLSLATARLEKIDEDLRTLENEGVDTNSLAEMRNSAEEHITHAESMLAEAHRLLNSVTSPYEITLHREALTDAHKLIIEANLRLREAYKIFFAMAQDVNA